MDVIREAEGAVALATLSPVILLLPVLVLLIGVVIRRQLRPLDRAASTIAQRAELSFEELPVDQLPAEVRPFVDEINRLLHRLEALIQREQQFVTDAAHALRTPLTALQLQAEVLEGGRDETEKAARLTELRSGIRRVIRLSEQLLSFARSKASAPATTAATDLQQLFQEVRQAYEPLAGAREVSLRTQAAPASVCGDLRRLTLVLGNLVDNAIRYSPRGAVVELRCGVDAGRARIEVWDEGCGLPPEELERVFERFYRVPGDPTSGSGLGLSTVDDIVRELGGTVALENRSDRSGLIAVVMLPTRAAGEPGLR